MGWWDNISYDTESWNGRRLTSQSNSVPADGVRVLVGIDHTGVVSAQPDAVYERPTSLRRRTRSGRDLRQLISSIAISCGDDTMAMLTSLGKAESVGECIDSLNPSMAKDEIVDLGSG
jgi:hypothetical protein